MHEPEIVPVAAQAISLSTWLKIIGCSLFGVFFFLVPLSINDTWTIVPGILANYITKLLGGNMKLFTAPIFIVGSLIAVVYNLSPRAFAKKLPLSEKLIASHWIWTVLAVISGIVSTMILFELGPEWVIGKNTGVTAYIDVAGAVFLLIGLGCLFLPFLTDYGLLEFIGTLAQKIFQKLFNLPGRATIDTLASWVGSSSIAVVMTSSQYEKGFYSARESAVIATNFSVVSIPFVLLTAQVAGIGDYFLQLYGSMLLVCTICAIVTPRIPPLSRFKDQYYGGEKRLNEDVDTGITRFQAATNRALNVATHAPMPATSLKKGFFTMLDIYLMMMPAAMTIEFLTLVVYYNTPIFQTIAAPFVFVLNVMQVPEAQAAAPGLILGIFDQFVPTIIAGTLTAPITKFVLAGLSVTQLIFFAETAILIMRSAIPISIWQLVIIFFIRTLICLPVLVLIGHFLF